MLSGGAESEDGEVGLARVGARYAAEDDGAGFGNQRACGAGDGDCGLRSGF